MNRELEIQEEQREKSDNMFKNKIILILIAGILLAALAACAGSEPEVVAETTSDLSETYTDALPIRTQLIVGTIKLEGSDQQVTAEQARQLLPLWQGSRALQRTGTGAQEEVAAVLNQIEDVMTPEQINAITDMRLTRTTLQETARSLGLVVGTDDIGTGPGANGQRGTGTGQPLRSGPNTSEMLLDELLAILESRLK